MKYFLLELGCQMNLSDAERISAVLDDMGMQKTDAEEEAQLLGVVACSVRQRAIDRVYSRIHKWNRWKNERTLITFATGCILEEDELKFLRLFDFLFRMPQLPQLPDMIRQCGVPSPVSLPVAVPRTRAMGTDFWRIQPRYSTPFQAWVPIQNGCDKFCSYCAVPYTRGREVSRASEEILAEVQQLLDNGCRSITLLGQNVNSYGLDRHGTEPPFPRLLDQIGTLGDKAGQQVWIYFTSPHPSDMNDELFSVMAAHPSLARQVHLPLQSGDDGILRRMNRSYTLADFRRLVGSLRRTLPEATLFTDIIVGYPGETEAAFQNTYAAMEEFRFQMAYIAVYSPRPGAASTRLADDIPHQEKKRRLHLLSDLLKESALQWHRSLVGTRLRVLVEGRDRKPGCLSGRSEGLTIVRFASSNEDLIGNFVDVEIESAAPMAVEGRLLPVH